MIIFGLTGGSGSGKTTASEILASLGAQIIDTDAIARKIAEKGSECLSKLVTYFGNEILFPDGTLNRKRLASIAFADEEKTEVLNGLTHQYIRKEVLEIIAHSSAEVIVIDGAVIIGSIIEPECDFIVSVTAERAVRIRRIKSRDGITDFQAEQRLDAQPDDEFYKAHSRYVIVNNGTKEELEIQVKEMYNKIKGVKN